MFSGGIGDKLGNRYEAKWLVRQLIDVITSKAEWLKFEGITTEFEGFEFSVGKGNIQEWHQTKINAQHGNWTINALKREKVLANFKKRLNASVHDRCVFVSQDPAKDLRTLTEKARVANDAYEFIQALSNDQKDNFNQVISVWNASEEISYKWLTRCECLTLPERELEASIASFSDLYFESGCLSVFPILRDYAENHFNKTLTTETVRADIRAGAMEELTIKDWSLDPTLRERLDSQTEAYLQTYTPFGAGGFSIPRSLASELADIAGKSDGPNIIPCHRCRWRREIRYYSRSYR